MPAVHQASVTLTAIAAADYTQIRTAAQTGRLLVPTTKITESGHILHPFARAPSDRVDSLLTAYRDAGTASVHATAGISLIAADIRAPSHILPTARAATHASGDAPQRNHVRELAQAAAATQPPAGMPGPVERTLRELGVTNHSLLSRGSALDQAAGQLIEQATRETAPQRWNTAVSELTKSAGTTQIINHVLAPGNPRAAAAPDPPAPAMKTPNAQAQPEPRQAEP